MASLLAVAVLGDRRLRVFSRGASALSLGFLTKTRRIQRNPRRDRPARSSGPSLIVAVATAIAMPLGILIALYLTEFAGALALARAIRLALDLMNGLPTIIVGLFVFGLLVDHHHQSGFAGSIALSIVMLPLIARATQEVLVLVPHSLREAADALGVSRWRTVLGVVLPARCGGIVTGAILAAARAAGETAPLLVSHASVFPNRPDQLLRRSDPEHPGHDLLELSGEPNQLGFARAWGAAFVLLA